MKIPDHLKQLYIKKFDPDWSRGFQVLEHVGGSTWNDGGSWYTTIIRVGDEILMVHMPSDYKTDDLKITKMKAVMKQCYEPL